MINFGKNFIVGFPDSELNQDLALKLKEIDPAGIILFDINFKTREQIKKLTADLKALLGNNLIISTDEEGGKVQRLRRFVDPLPSFKALGLSNQEAFESFAETLCSNLGELGFNLAYSPCADINTEALNPIIGPRSFGSDPEAVAKQVSEFTKLLKKQNLISCAKHFPGHGSSLQDSHLGLPKITYNSYQEFERHLLPFKAAIVAGVDMVMVAHLAIEILDTDKYDSEKDLPTSLSKKFIRELLREELNFDGLTISDEITMKALERFGDYSDRARLMLEAGNDLIIWHTNIDDALKAARRLNSSPSPELEKIFLVSQARISKLTSNTRHGERNAVIGGFGRGLISNIASRAMEYSNPQSKKLNFENAILLYNKHPKLERDIIDRVFKDLPKMEFSDQKALCERSLEKFEKVIILEFQTALNPQLSEAIEAIKKKRAGVTVISTDITSPYADINLNGCGELHFRALVTS